MTLPPDFPWHQSSITTYLTCPRRFELQYVRRVEPNPYLDHCAGLVGTAVHAGIDHTLHTIRAAETWNREETRLACLRGFEEGLARAERKGQAPNPETAQAALDRLNGEHMDRLEYLAGDSRIGEIDWRGIEDRFEWRDREGRLWRGTIDAWGVVNRNMLEFGWDGRHWVGAKRGDVILTDWKSHDFDLPTAARMLNVQLPVYNMALRRARNERRPARLFIARLRDLDRPKRPFDENGQPIKSKLVRLNPEYVKAVGLPEAQAEKSRKRPKDASGSPIPKRLEEDNSAYLEAIENPKGPLFHEIKPNWGLVRETIANVIRGAEAGVFPASGAQTGQCRRCEFRSSCTQGK